MSDHQQSAPPDLASDVVREYQAALASYSDGRNDLVACDERTRKAHKALLAWSPAPPASPVVAPAPEAMPEIQVGDLLASSMWDGTSDYHQQVTAANIAYHRRNPQGVDAIYRDPIWRRPVEPPPAPEQET